MGYDAVILGAGPAGLAVAHAMLRAGAKVKVLEPAAHVGGSIRTHLDAGWIVETGPNTLQLEGAEDEALMAAYGLGEIMQSADMRAARRYIFARGELHGLGPSPLTLLTSKLLTWSGKLRLLSEPFRAKGGHADETVVEFATRRFGPEAAAMLMDPIVSGVHAGDPARLVMASCFPRIHALEKTYGSILNGMRRGPKTKRTVVGFPGGMRQLADEVGCSVAQLALAWVLARGETLVPIPGTRRIRTLEENAAAADLVLTADDLAQIEAVFPKGAASGHRYAEAARSSHRRARRGIV